MTSQLDLNRKACRSKMGDHPPPQCYLLHNIVNQKWKAGTRIICKDSRMLERINPLFLICTLPNF